MAPSGGTGLGRAALLACVLAAGVAAVFAWHRGDPGAAPTSPAAGTEPSARAMVAIDARRQQLAGIVLEKVVRGRLSPEIPAVGVIGYDRTRLTDVSMRVDGWIRDVWVQTAGTPVAAGQKLLSLNSPELVSLQSQFLSAVRNQELVPAGASQNTQPQYADRLVDTPRERLLRADVPEDQLRELEEKRRILPALVFRSPVQGVVIEVNAIKGMHVRAGERLYRLADLSVLWLEAEVPEADLPALELGASARARVAAWPAEEFPGRVVGISPAVAQSGGTVSVRVELPDPDGRLKPGMPVRVALGAPEREGLIAPEDAVIDSGARQLVFVAQPNGYFEPREVKAGARADGRVLILSGLREDEQVARRGAFLIDSESQMRAALQNYAAPAVSAQADGLDIRIAVAPDPPRAGDNAIEVRIRDQSGRPVTDLEVSMLCSMPAMPSMNMPAMRSEARLGHAGDGVYTGVAQLSMAGRWDVAVTAERGGSAVATAQAAFNVR